MDTWLNSTLRSRCLRVLIELPDGLTAVETAAEADRLIDKINPTTLPVLLHGEGSSAWPALEHGRLHRLATRVGLEDMLNLPDGSTAPGNAALVTAAIRMLTAFR